MSEHLATCDAEKFGVSCHCAREQIAGLERELADRRTLLRATRESVTQALAERDEARAIARHARHVIEAARFCTALGTPGKHVAAALRAYDQATNASDACVCDHWQRDYPTLVTERHHRKCKWFSHDEHIRQLEERISQLSGYDASRNRGSTG